MEKTAQFLAPPLGSASPNIIPYPKQGNWFPYSTSTINSLGSGKVLRGNNLPVPKKVIGQLLPSFFNDFYFRVHVVPTELDLGNIVSSQELDIYLWNSHFSRKRLNAISGISDGLILKGKVAPAAFGGLEEQHYKVTITPDGSSVIDDKLIWDFTEENPSLHLTGDRVVAFGFMPDWQTDGVIERLEWSTNILTSETGIEQRSALYAAPRRYFNANFYIADKDRQLFNNMTSWYARNWAVPLWPYIQFIKQPLTKGDTTIYCNTKSWEFKVNGLAFLWLDTSTYEIAEIVAVNDDNLQVKRPLFSDWPIGTRIYPAVTSVFATTPSFRRKTDQFAEVNIEFRVAEVSTYSINAPQKNYKGYPVFDLLPDESEELNNQYQQILTLLDNNMALPRVTDNANNSFFIQGFRWLAMGHEEKATFRAFLYFLNGQQKAIWLPSHEQDLTVIDTITADNPAIAINYCGYNRFAKGDTDKKYIYIWLKDGAIFYREIVNSSNEGDKERLMLDEPLGRKILPEQILRISYMRLCRLNNDAVEIKHMTDIAGVASSNIVFRRVLDNEL